LRHTNSLPPRLHFRLCPRTYALPGLYTTLHLKALPLSAMARPVHRTKRTYHASYLARLASLLTPFAFATPTFLHAAPLQPLHHFPRFKHRTRAAALSAFPLFKTRSLQAPAGTTLPATRSAYSV